MNIKQTFFTGSLVKHWNMLPRSVESASLEGLKRCVVVAVSDKV